MPAAAFSLYIIQCGDGTLYTGIATDVERRLAEHAAGRRGAKYLKSRLPHKLVFAEQVGSRSLALRLEARVKKLPRSAKLELVAGRVSLANLLPEVQVPVVEASPT
jgi:putative endonuclease